MLNLYERFVEESYNACGRLDSFSPKIPDHFNFGFDCVDAIATREPDRRALMWCNPEGEEHEFSFAEIALWSDKTAAALADAGVKRGDFVLVILRRHYQFWFVAPALAKIGAIMVPATFMLKEHDMEYRLREGGISAVIATDTGDVADVVDAVAPRCPELRNRFLVAGGGSGLGGPVAEGICTLHAVRDGWHDFNAIVAAADGWNYERARTSPYDPMLMYFSSGTSGNPKMVLHNGTYALAHLVTARHWQCVDPDGLHFTIADTGWGKAVWGKLYGAWLMEAAVLAYDFDRFDAAEILPLFGRFGITTFCAPPTMYRMLLHEGLDGYDLSSLEHSVTAGEAMNPDLYEEWHRKTGLTIFEGFGQTETPLTVANLRNAWPRPGSMGKPVPLYETRILDEDGNECEMGRTGELCIRLEGYAAEGAEGAQAAEGAEGAEAAEGAGAGEGAASPGTHAPLHRTPGIMMGYYRNPERTAAAFRGGWYHTGDTAWKDEDGYFWYVGRNDDVIKSSGYRIGPFEIESVLLEHSAVKECAVTGVPDELRGQAVKATVVLAEGFEPADYMVQELQTWVKRRTAPYKFPRIVDFVDSLPKTVNGKIRRTEIRRADWARANEDNRSEA